MQTTAAPGATAPPGTPGLTLPGLTDPELALRAEVRDFLTEQLPPGYRPGLGIAARHDPAFSRKLADRGWVGMAIPAAYGGHDRSAVERFIVTEELMAAGAPIGAHYVADRQTAPTILRFGTEEQKETFLPQIAAGRCWFSLGMSEPDAGSDLAAARTRAQRTDGGWLVTGTKVWTSNAHLNHAMVTLVRTSPPGSDRHGGLSQLIVDLHAPGVEVRPIPFIDGTHHFNEVSLLDVFVPDDRVLGQVGEGWHQVTAELGYERSGPDRYMSTVPIIREFTRNLAQAHDGTADEAAHRSAYVVIGRLAARLGAIREMSLAVARRLDQGEPPTIAAALVKDLGTLFEQDCIEKLRSLAGTPVLNRNSDMFATILAEGILTGPTFTLRGGTTEILRSVAARGLRT